MTCRQMSSVCAFSLVTFLAWGCYHVTEPDWDGMGGAGGDFTEHSSIPGFYWHNIEGGVFEMGNNDILWSDPEHLVDVVDFDLSRSEITVAQYSLCVEAGQCLEPLADYESCNYWIAGREDHPVNCLSWQASVDFCEWAGGRLPSEAEWEFAARGKDERPYPWGDVEANCDLAVMDGSGGFGCGSNSTWEVCSRPDGRSPEGLCDLAGNVGEWVQDWFHDNYEGAPTDGSSWEYPVGYQRVVRGGSFRYNAYQLLSAKRYHSAADVLVGFRCAR